MVAHDSVDNYFNDSPVGRMEQYQGQLKSGG